MYLLMLILCLLIISVVYYILDKDWCKELSGAILLVMIMLSFLSIILVPVFRYSDNLMIVEINEARRTIEEQRTNDNISDAERIMFSEKIIEYNTWIEKAKNNASNKWISIYTSSDVLNVEPIK